MLSRGLASTQLDDPYEGGIDVVKATTPSTELTVLEISKGRMAFAVMGRTPLVCNRLSEKARRELLLPTGRKSAAARAETLKHDPIAEYRASPYRATGDDVETRILMPCTAFKRALRDVAVDIPGAAKAQVGRLTYVEGVYVSVYGIPQLFMVPVRSADMNRTPDIRTRAILPEWACHVTVSFVKPLLREQIVANLFSAAGMMRGIGDWRPEKGAGDFGQFDLVDHEDPEFARVVAEGGRVAQDAAFESPECYDDETASLLAWFQSETKTRGLKAV